jgi:hypothetical protein
MVQKMSLSSNSYPKNVNEFTKAGFSMMSAQKIKPPYVKEAPIAMESRVDQVISLGGEGASGNLVICRILLMHVQEKFLDKNDQLDTTRIDLVGRMGGNWYCRAFDKSLFEVNKPGITLAIGVDQLPEHVLKSDILSANDVGVLGSLTYLPLPGEIQAAGDRYKQRNSSLERNHLKEIHREIKNLIEQKNAQEALALSFWYIS